MATIGRNSAIAQIEKLRLTGFLAWVAWLFIHIMNLIGYRNRAQVMFQWMWASATPQRGARLITEHPPRLTKLAAVDENAVPVEPICTKEPVAVERLEVFSATSDLLLPIAEQAYFTAINTSTLSPPGWWISTSVV